MGLILPSPEIEALLLIVAVAAAVYDVRYRRIPNWISAGGIALGVLANSLTHGIPGLLLSLGGFAMGFGLYFLLYVIHVMGAGDVKLMGAVGALVGWKNWVAIFVIAAVLGGIMATILIVARDRVKKTFWNIGYWLNEMRWGRAAHMSREELDVRNAQSVGLPHAAVIAVATIFYLALVTHFVR